MRPNLHLELRESEQSNVVIIGPSVLAYQLALMQQILPAPRTLHAGGDSAPLSLSPLQVELD